MGQRKNFAGRFYFLAAVLLLGFLTITWRLLDLNIFNSSFLQHQSNARTLRTIDTPANRGMILDRNGAPLAISVPVDSVWINPQIFVATATQLKQLAKFLLIEPTTLQKKLANKQSQWFIYLKRHIDPQIANNIKALNIPGLYFQREYQRFYPEGEVTAHVLGFTNIDDKGQEGLELAFDSWLQGTPGKTEVLKDRPGHIIAVIKTLSSPKEGHNLTLSIDRRIQYIAYYELKKTIDKYRAEAGTVVVLDTINGEILAMVNQPSYNPNNRPAVHDGRYRNRAITDSFEPGSTIKTFSVASALASGKYFPNTKIDTNPGWYYIDGNKVSDDNINHGILTVTGVLQKSSNIGIAKITLSLPAKNLWNLLRKVGLSESTGSGFPGEVTGSIVDLRELRPFALATLSFGYGLSITPLQLACAYSVIASGGIKIPPTFLKQNKPATGARVMDQEIAKQMLQMLQAVLELGGTGTRAQIAGYTVAGKTGTARIATQHGYDKNQHISTFVGIAPTTKPRLVVAVIIKNPQGEDFGGLVAAPAFASIMESSLRIMGVPPDDLGDNHEQ